MTINLEYIRGDNSTSGKMYRPLSDESKVLVDHLMGEEMFLISEYGLLKLKLLARAHDWNVSVSV